ncbi:lysoplasmalogenase [Primorskyibacter aestuariivivens]|uniref:lysoplasmalogenase n=1 Tax=Primorskyibacter aestuariivivens TaxID=1888912 RepID=UPI002300A510|nr:lysoplasmalogenase [Primorskyibacter aestuariivivens]MDA7427427.1 lysoplasmalogenase [Primorskyibacter aestuariivivens]
MTAWALSLAAASALITLLRFAARGPSMAKTVIKTLSVALLALVSFAEALPVLLTVALALGALGDAFLSRDGDATFLGGLGSFALSHIAYTALFVAMPGFDAALLTEWPAAPLAVALLLLAVGLGIPLWRAAGALRIPVMIYVVLIVLMGLSAIAVGAPILWAAVLFVISDALLGSKLFLIARDSRWQNPTDYLVWLSYWVAQAVFLLGFLMLGLTPATVL